MQKEKIKNLKRKRRKIKIRAQILGTPNIPRCSVYRSLNNISAQIIDDKKSETILSFSNNSLKDTKGKNKNEISFLVGEELGKLCISKKINETLPLACNNSKLPYAKRRKTCHGGPVNGRIRCYVKAIEFLFCW